MDISAVNLSLFTPSAKHARRPAEAPSDPRESFVRSSEAPPERPRRPMSTSAVEQLLRDMKPFIRDVHVVSPGGADGSPPILGGTGAGTPVVVPEALKATPGHRWECTPDIAQFHRERVQAESNDELRAADQNELEPMVTPLLQKRYGDREGMAVVELGPATSTVVPRALGESVNRYFSMDLSVPLLERQRDLLHEPGFLVSGAVGVIGNSYDMPFESGRSDVVFTSCHPPFVSSTVADRIQAFAEVHRVLKEGGEFILFPWNRDEQHPAVNAFVEKHFEQVDSATSPYGGGREMVVLRKRG